MEIYGLNDRLQIAIGLPPHFLLARFNSPDPRGPASRPKARTVGSPWFNAHFGAVGTSRGVPCMAIDNRPGVRVLVCSQGGPRYCAVAIEEAFSRWTVK